MLGCLATILGGITLAQYRDRRPDSWESLQRPGRQTAVVAHYAYLRAEQATGLQRSHGSLFVQVRRDLFLGEMHPDEQCGRHSAGEGAGRDDRWETCMSRLTSRQTKP
jgi:hypothetical protein